MAARSTKALGENICSACRTPVFVLFYAGTCPNPEQVLDRKDDDGNVFKTSKRSDRHKKAVHRFQMTAMTLSSSGQLEVNLFFCPTDYPQLRGQSRRNLFADERAWQILCCFDRKWKSAVHKKPIFTWFLSLFTDKKIRFLWEFWNFIVFFGFISQKPKEWFVVESKYPIPMVL